MFNKVVFVGYLTRDVEVRFTPSGIAVATIPLAINTKTKSGDEVREEELFIDCVVFGKQAENSGQYLSKGSLALIEGRLRKKEWEYEGQKKSKMEVIANTVRFLSLKKDVDTPIVDENSEVPEREEPF